METSSTRAYTIDKIFISIVFGVFFGIIFDTFFKFRFDIYVILIAGCVCVAFGIFLNIKNKQLLFYVGIVCFATILGIIRIEIANSGAHSLEQSVGQKITLSGVIDVPISKTYNVQSTLSTNDGQHILVYAPKYPVLAYGDNISITGILQKPKNFLTDQGTEFDYVSYLYKDDIVYVVPNGKATIISRGNGNALVSPLLVLKNWFVRGYERILPPDEADLMGGLTLGTKENISKEFRNNLVTTSTIHIIALSGYNVTIVANFLREMLSRIPFVGGRGALVGGGIGIIFFVTMTGMQSSAIRAGIMALIALFGRGTGRTYDAFRALVFAGFGMVLWNPKYLIYDVSFQLSFLATLGMIFLTPVFLKLFKNIPENIFGKIPLREMMATTLGAQLSVLPFIIYKMGVLSLIALPANILVLPSIPFAMGIGTVAGLVGNFSIVLATPFAFVTHLFLQYITVLINFFANVPFAYVAFHNVSIVVCLALYASLIFWIYKNKSLFN